MKGRKRIPTKIKALKGTLQPCRTVNEPEPAVFIPQAPGHLDKIALEEWERITVELHRLGLISEISRAALAAYCMTYSRWVQAEKILQKSELTVKTKAGVEFKMTGLIVKTMSGNIIQNPLVGVANRALEIMHKYLTEFGMTPSSKSRVNVTEKKKENPFEVLNSA